MMKYERVTNKEQTWHEYNGSPVDIYNKLTELEDRIEQGTLSELNDKLIGASVYGIQQDTKGKYWFDGDENTLLGFTSNGIVTWNDSHGYNDWFKNGLWFFTREKAEEKMKELEG